MPRSCYICRERPGQVELTGCRPCGAEAFLCLECDAQMPPGMREVAEDTWREHHVHKDCRHVHLAVAVARMKRAIDELHIARQEFDACELPDMADLLSRDITSLDNARAHVASMVRGH